MNAPTRKPAAAAPAATTTAASVGAPAAAAAAPTNAGPQPAAPPGVTQQSTTGILKLATQSDELTVSQLASQATRLVPPPVDVQKALEQNTSVG